MPELEPISAVPAFAGLAIPGMRDREGGLLVAERRNLGLASVTPRRGMQAHFVTTVAETFGITLVEGTKISSSGNLSFIGTGPGGYLALKASGGWRFADDLRAALADTAAVCDHSSGYGVLRLSGPHARTVLARGIPLDLDPISFGPGDAAVTLASHFGIVLWQVDQMPTYDIAVSRSFAGSFWHWLETSAATVGFAVTDPMD